MNRDDFINVIRRLIVEARRAELAGKIDDAREAAGYDDVGDFVNSLFNVTKDSSKPKLNVVPPKKRVPLGPLLEEGWEWGHKGAFDHRDDPQKFIEFCSPYSSKRNKYLDEMSEHQSNMIEMIHEDVSRAKARVKKKISKATVEEAMRASDEIDSVVSTIEDALHDAVRKKSRETGEDSA